MSTFINRVHISGYLSDDPKQCTNKLGESALRIVVATKVAGRYGGKTELHQIEVTDDHLIAKVKTLKKGSKLSVTGYLHSIQWMNGDSRRSRLTIVADNISDFVKYQNTVVISGNTGKMPRSGNNKLGEPNQRISIATNKVAEGAKVTEWHYVDFNNGSFSDDLAAMKIGEHIYIEGHLRMLRWFDDGRKNSQLTIVADRLVTLKRSQKIRAAEVKVDEQAQPVQALPDFMAGLKNFDLLGIAA